jgi:glycosyltransferase involved in cell wall biosynthesis
VDEVLPLVESELGYQTRLTIVGFSGEGVDLQRFRNHPRITLRGEVTDTCSLYDAHRVFIAPTRYAAGVPYKVHEAASYGLPVVATELLREQLGWQNQRDLMAAEASDPERFANSVVSLYRSEDLWISIRRSAAERIRESCGPDGYEQALSHILGARGTKSSSRIQS